MNRNRLLSLRGKGPRTKATVKPASWFAAGAGDEFVHHLENFFCSGAHFVAFRQVEPEDFAVRVEQKFRGAGDVRAAETAGVQQVIAANDFGFGVGKKWEGVALFFAMLAGDIHGVHADGDNAHAAGGKFVQILLKTPQLGVAVGSPIAAVKDEEKRG